jgi:hypothetical protein
VAVTGVWRYDSPGAYVADSPGILRPFVRVNAMYDSGFTEGMKTEFSVGSDSYFLSVLGFASNATAVDYARVHLDDACHLVEEVVPLPSGNGVAYRRVDGLRKAVFVVGNNEISVDLCTCVEDGPLTVVSQWAADIEKQAGQPADGSSSGDPAPADF